MKLNNILQRGKYFSILISSFSISMAFAHAQEADSLVNVAFGQIDKLDAMGSVSSVSVSSLLEKDYHQGSLDDLSALIGGYNGSVWGQAPLVLVDGFPRDASYLNASEVETVTVLKGASAVTLYGSRAAKGVVLITTKRGKESPLRIDVRANTGFYVPKSYPQYLKGADYMTLYNEACANDGISARYTDAQIYNTAAGTNPYRYADVYFYSKDYVKSAFNRTDATAEVYGGGDKTKYYTNFGVVFTDDLMKFGESKNNSNWRFNVRGNIDMEITSWLTASADAAVNFTDNYHARGSQESNYWGAATLMRPNWFSPFVPLASLDPFNKSIQAMAQNSSHIYENAFLYGGTSTDKTNVFADMMSGGYIRDKQRQFMFDVKVKADLDKVLRGLTFELGYGIDYAGTWSEAFAYDYAAYEPQWSTMNGVDMITGLTKYNEDKASTSEYVGNSIYNEAMTFYAQFDWKRQFRGVHNVAAKIMGLGFQTHHSADENHGNSDYHKPSNFNGGIQASYNYAHKYYADFTGALVHSAKLPVGKRNAFSPSFTLGYRLSEENWIKERASWIDDLKIDASFTRLNQDLDISSYYLYKGYFEYSTNAGWYQWYDGTAGGKTTASKRGDNPDLDFVKTTEWRVGLHGAFLKGALTVDANWFLSDTKGLLTQASSTVYPAYFQNWDFSFLPYINYNNDRRQGFDFSVGYKKKFGQVEMQLGFVGMYLKTKATRRDQVVSDAYQSSVGRALDVAWGYECEGFFQSDAEIANHPDQTFGAVKPGNLKYKDQNNDGKIDSRDQVELGQWSAPFSYGLNLTVKWNNFTFFALGTGQNGGIAFKNNFYYQVYGDRKYSEEVWGRWTPATAATATYPRLSTTNNSNDFQSSDFWKYSTDCFRLSKLQLTYDFPKTIFEGTIFQGLSVYATAENLLTFSKNRSIMELNVGSAPQCRFYNVGLKVNF